MITPSSTNRQITLGGSDEVMYLNLTSSELNNITAGTVQIGANTFDGGIAIGGAIAPTNFSTLSLINKSSGVNATISQTAPITIANLKADARSVDLSNSGNQISQLSGVAYAGTFSGRSASALQIGAVDGVNGVTGTTTGTVTLHSSGLLTLNQNTRSLNGSLSLTGTGITLGSGTTVSGNSMLLNAHAAGGAMQLGAGHPVNTTTGQYNLNNAASVVLGNTSANTGLGLINISGAVTQEPGTAITAGVLSGNTNTGSITLGNAGNNFSGSISTCLPRVAASPWWMTAAAWPA